MAIIGWTIIIVDAIATKLTIYWTSFIHYHFAMCVPCASPLSFDLHLYWLFPFPLEYRSAVARLFFFLFWLLKCRSNIVEYFRNVLPITHTLNYFTWFTFVRVRVSTSSWHPFHLRPFMTALSFFILFLLILNAYTRTNWLHSLLNLITLCFAAWRKKRRIRKPNMKQK